MLDIVGFIGVSSDEVSGSYFGHKHSIGSHKSRWFDNLPILLAIALLKAPSPLLIPSNRGASRRCRYCNNMEEIRVKMSRLPHKTRPDVVHLI